jgi:hypothetical protein
LLIFLIRDNQHLPAEPVKGSTRPAPLAAAQTER